MVLREPNPTYLDQFTCFVEEFLITTNELYKQDKLIFNKDKYREVRRKVDNICDLVIGGRDLNNVSGEESTRFNFDISNEVILEDIGESMENIQADLEKAISLYGQKGTTNVQNQKHRTGSLKYVAFWENLLDKSNEINETKENSYNDSGSLVKRRIQEFNKKDRRKSSTVYSLSLIGKDEPHHLRCSCKTLSKSQSVVDEKSVVMEVKNNVSEGGSVMRTIRSLHASFAGNFLSSPSKSESRIVEAVSKYLFR